jgi:hypothetical protein
MALSSSLHSWQQCLAVWVSGARKQNMTMEYDACIINGFATIDFEWLHPVAY